MKKLNFALLSAMLLGLLTFSACSDDDAPPAENEEEVIDQVTLTFTETGTTNSQSFVAVGPGGVNFTLQTITLDANTTYQMVVTVANTEEGEDITQEIATEDEEHMFFFGWTSGLFSDPTGDGNIGATNRGDDVNYEDEDANGEPLGLITTWTTGDAATGEFRVILKHQPDIKSATSTSNDGESDIDLTWDITIQ